METAQQLFSKIWAQSSRKWAAVHSFRRVGQLGLPHAKVQLSREYKHFAYTLVSDDSYAKLFVDRSRFIADGLVNTLHLGMTGQSVASFEAALDAASLVFAHSILDSTALDYCRACALAAPLDWLERVEDRKLSLREAQEKDFDSLLASITQSYLDGLEKESLLRKLDLLFAVCKPPAGYAPMENYSYDRERIVALDALRHDYVHGAGPAATLPNGDDDLLYLERTTYFLMCLVNSRYDLKMDFDYLREEWMSGRH